MVAAMNFAALRTPIARLPEPEPERRTSGCARTVRALQGQAARARILAVLEHGPATTLELAAETGMQRKPVRDHVRRLIAEGVVRRAGKVDWAALWELAD